MDVNKAMAVAAAEIAADIDREIIMSILFPYSAEKIFATPEKFNWLLDNIGNYNVNWNYSGRAFYFKTEQDMMLFTLRWA